MSNVVNIKPNLNIPQGLRNIADAIDSGEIEATECTIVMGTEIFHLGCFSDENAAVNTIFDLTLGIQLMMKPVVDDAQNT